MEELKAFAENVEAVLENPEALISDLTGIDITAIIDNLIEQIPDDIQDLETYFINNYELIDIKIEGYLPLRDRFSPYFFFPRHCYPNDAGDTKKDGLSEATSYNSPVIAYVSTGASVE